MINRFVSRNRLLVSLLILVLCVSMTVPALAYDPSTLYNGCSGEEVRAMQQALIDLGYLDGKADGVFGNKTEKAVRRFQYKNGMTADGLAGRKTLSALASAKGGNSAPAGEAVTAAPAQAQASAQAQTQVPAPTQAPAQKYKATTLYNGCSGEEVRAMQQALIDLGFFQGEADGSFGDQTEAAVKAFQRANGLKADGLAGSKTRTVLNSAQKRKSAPATEGTAPAQMTAAESQVIDETVGIDWAPLEQKARQILQAEGHSTEGLNYITHFYAPKGNSGLAYDYYRVSFYKSRETSVYEWTYVVDFDPNGKLVSLWADPRGGKREHKNEPKAGDVDKDLLAKAKDEIKAYLNRYGYSSLAKKISKLKVTQISFSEDKTETFYTFSGPFIIRVRVAPSVRVDYFNDN